MDHEDYDGRKESIIYAKGVTVERLRKIEQLGQSNEIMAFVNC